MISIWSEEALKEWPDSDACPPRMAPVRCFAACCGYYDSYSFDMRSAWFRRPPVDAYTDGIVLVRLFIIVYWYGK